ncbi:hypothetical protein [Pseudoxanthomonas dokdonensis]|uniref:hypothetical protein n=1 Tax=Pseudoxanthomonas dokdonensis TaxID=344882 RepID=UPI0009F9ECF7|nr:hypothetical protein [Pseudoxanthomonas dokdonensis]
MPRLSFLSCLALLAIVSFAATVWPLSAQTVQRCTGMDGKTVYTDKRCEDVGAMDRLPDPSATVGATRNSLYRDSCSRTLSDLVRQITAAADARDVNRLASIYWWSGVSNASANRILDRLEAVVERPLISIDPIRPAPPPILDASGNVVDDNADGYYPQSSQRDRPVALRLQQTLRNSATPSSTVLQLRRSYKCFWITL